MDPLKSVKDNPIARAGAYIIYNIPPVQIALGIVRIVVVAGCAIAHQVYNWQINRDYNERKEQRQKENKKGTLLTKVGNAIEDGVDYAATKMIRKGTHIFGMHDQNERMKKEAKRAMAEITIVGAWYYTYNDYHRNCSVWGLSSLVKLLEMEEKLYMTVQDMRNTL